MEILDLYEQDPKGGQTERSASQPSLSRARLFDVDLRSTARRLRELARLRQIRTFFPTSSLTFLSSSKIFPLFPLDSACCPRSPSSSALSWFRRVASGEPDPEVGELVARAILFLISFWREERRQKGLGKGSQLELGRRRRMGRRLVSSDWRDNDGFTSEKLKVTASWYALYL